MSMRLAGLAALPLALWAQAPAPSASPSPCNNTPTYSPCELTFELSEKDAAAHPNPYATVDLRIEFRSPRRRTYAMPAFWDGGRRLVVRFSPVEAGDWDYHVTSNIGDWNDKTGSFSAAASESPGFLRAANLHHWAYTERNKLGLDQAHLWMGVTELQFASLDDAAFRAAADARAAQKFTHLRGLAMPGGAKTAYPNPDSPDLAFFQRLDSRVRYLNQKGLIADLILAAEPADLVKAFPSPPQRRRFVRYLVARYAPFHVTWQAAERFEDDPDGRAILREAGGLIKELDPYSHPRTSGGKLTSTPLLPDRWMDFAAQGTYNSDLAGVEHQLYPVPFVNLNLGREGEIDAATVRRRLWNATMDGQSPTYAGADPNAAGAKAMTAWFEFMSGTRYWELEPYFDVDGGRAVALEDIEYVVYVEKPGPVELTVEKHGYEVYWVNPIDGEQTPKKKFSGEHFTGEPPDRSHDWVLHVVRESQLASMAKSVKFSSREQDLVLQEVEANTPKVPFAIEQPVGDLSLSRPNPYSAKITRETRATRSMRWVWMGEVAADNAGYRVLATGQKGAMQVSPGIARDFPALMHLRLYGMNANGKVYELDAACQINR
jgi:hypothetical protein